MNLLSRLDLVRVGDALIGVLEVGMSDSQPLCDIVERVALDYDVGCHVDRSCVSFFWNMF